MTSKTRKRITAIIVTLALSSSFALCGGNPIAAEKTNNLSKIDPALSERMEAAANYEKIPVTLWVQDISVSDTEIEAETVQNAEALLASPQAMAKTNISDDLSEEMALVSARTHARRTLYAEKYAESNEAILEHLLSTSKIRVQKTILEGEKATWISHYSPVIKLSLTKSEIYTIIVDNTVENVFLDDFKWEPTEITVQSENYLTSIATWQAATNVTYLHDLGYNGSGVKVGLLDAGLLKYNALDSTQKAVFSALYNSGRLICDSAASTGDISHPVLCGSLIAGSSSTGTGVAPGVTLYSTTAEGRTGGTEGALEWLISKDVGVIVIPMGGGNENAYDYGSRWLDHIAIQHEVTFVTCSGNQGSSGVLDAGMAYNAITVGSSDCKATASRTDDAVSSFSSYRNSTTGVIKPDVVAPGNDIATPSGVSSGTSLSAPITAGIIALLYQMRPGLTSMQQVTKSILMAGISDCGTALMARSSTNSIAPALKNNSGAGLIDGKGARWIAANSRYVGYTFTASTSTYTKTYTVGTNEKLTRIALAWGKYNRISGNHGTYVEPSNPACAQLFLQVKTPSGKVYKSQRSGGNTQLICFKPTESGTYTITVTKISAPVSEPRVHFGLSWY